jgi:hypothetical protein
MGVCNRPIRDVGALDDWNFTRDCTPYSYGMASYSGLLSYYTI